MHIKDNRVSNFESKEWMNSKVGLIKVKAFIKPQHKTLSTAKYQKSARKYMATRWQLHFLGQPRPFCQWLAALAFIYSLATAERTHEVFRRSLNGHVSVLLLLAMGLSTCQETFGCYWHFILHHCFTTSYISLFS